MEDYPRELTEFEARLAAEEACGQYLFRLRWPDRFRCPRCGREKYWPLRGVLLQVCWGAVISHQTSVIAGTIFQDTPSPLRLWFQATWCVVAEKNGASALVIQRMLGLRSYEKAWTRLHQLRRAVVRPACDRVGQDSGDRWNLPGRTGGRRARSANRKESPDCSCGSRRWTRCRTHRSTKYLSPKYLDIGNTKV